METLKAAREWRLPPTTLICGRPEKWVAEDRLLVLALHDYETTRLDHLKLPKRATEEGDNEGWWEVEEHTNAAQQALDQYQKDRESRELGVVTRLVDSRMVGPAE